MEVLPCMPLPRPILTLRQEGVTYAVTLYDNEATDPRELSFRADQA